MKEYRVGQVNRFIVIENDPNSRTVKEICPPCTLREANSIAESFAKSHNGTAILGEIKGQLGVNLEISKTKNPKIKISSPPWRYVVHGIED